jgi:transcriptional regulator with XRE-family HTH domain
MPKLMSPDDSVEWLHVRLREIGLRSIADLEARTGLNKGTISKYFRQLQRPSISVVPILCSGLEVSPATLLAALGVLPIESSSKE